MQYVVKGLEFVEMALSLTAAIYAVLAFAAIVILVVWFCSDRGNLGP